MNSPPAPLNFKQCATCPSHSVWVKMSERTRLSLAELNRKEFTTWLTVSERESFRDRVYPELPKSAVKATLQN